MFGGVGGVSVLFERVSLFTRCSFKSTDPGSACMGAGQFMLDSSYFAYRPTVEAGGPRAMER